MVAILESMMVDRFGIFEKEFERVVKVVVTNDGEV